MTARTRYQRTHHPVKVVEVRCTSRKSLDGAVPGDPSGFCPDCGRFLLRGGRDHKPNRTGSFGWVEHYGDGSQRVTDPE